MTDFNTYKFNKEKKILKQHQQNRELIEQQEKQLELYEANTDKVNIKAHIELAGQYYNNHKNSEHSKINADDLLDDFNLL